MKREILFKGKRIDNKEWVEGNLVMVCNGETLKRYPCIVISYNHDTFDWLEVDPKSVSQFTGKTIPLKHPMFDDKLKLFENDIFTFGNSKTKYKVVFEDYEWVGVSNEGDDWGAYKCRLSQIREEMHIIGNLTDDPKLMNGAD